MNGKVPEPDRGRELIQKYLDEVIDQAELTELELLLISNPDAAREFARASRTDSFIYFRYNQIQAEKSLPALQPPPVEAPTATVDLAPAATPMHRPAVARRIYAPALEPVPARARRKARQFMEHLVGPTGSVLIHIVIIALLITLVTQRAPEPPEKGITVTMLTKDSTFEPPDVYPPEPPPESGSGTGTGGGAGSEEPSAPAGTVAGPGEPDFTPLKPDNEPVDTRGIDISQADSPMTIQGLRYGGSRSGEGRDKALGQYGKGTRGMTESAVVKALDWLKSHQDKDGSWGPNRVAMTGLAVLTFLAHGETPSSERYGKTVEAGIKYLLGRQQVTGAIGDTSTQGGPYEHAIATYALCEAYGLTRVTALKQPMEQAVQVILAGQQAGGGWDYRYSRGGRRDTSVAGWQIQALKAARMAGAETPGLNAALDKAAEDLKRARDPATGMFRYTDATSAASEALTGIGVLSLELLGEGDGREVRDGLKALAKADCRWKEPPAWPLYGWYYVTQAKFNARDGWDEWNAKFARAYAKAQNEDGSWTSPAQDEAKYGPVYSTAFAALTLQVYYRFLPTYSLQNEAAGKSEPAKEVRVNVGE